MGSQPFFIHANGNGKLDNVIKQLNYNINDDEIINIDNASHNAVTRKVVYYSKFYYHLIMMCIIIYVICMMETSHVA